MQSIEYNKQNHQIYDILADLQKQIIFCKVPAHVGVREMKSGKVPTIGNIRFKLNRLHIRHTRLIFGHLMTRNNQPPPYVRTKESQSNIASRNTPNEGIAEKNIILKTI